MTREEAKKVWDKVHPLALDLNTVIDIIYDDFKNKSCDGCKYDEKDENYPTICWECSRYYDDRYELKGKQ